MKNMQKKIFGVILAVFMLALSAQVGAADITVNEIVSGLDYNWIGSFSEGLAPVSKQEKIGFIDKTGKLVIPCIYNLEDPFNGGVAKVYLDGKWNYIDTSGKVLITIDYDDVGNFSDDMAWIRKGDKYGYIDKSGELVLPMIYDTYNDDYEGITNLAHDFSEGLAAVGIDGKCGFIDKTGELVIPAIYDGNFFHGEWLSYIPTFHEGLARVKMEGVGWDGTWGCINTKGEVVIPFEYSHIGNGHTGHFCNGFASVGKGDKAGLIDKNGNVITLDYYVISNFNGTLAYVELENQEDGAYIDKTGKVVTPFEYKNDQWNSLWYAPSSEGMTVAYKKECGYGILDSEGNIILPFENDLVESFSNGLAYVYNRNSTSGYIDKTGKFIFPTDGYTSMAHEFSEGLAWVCTEFGYGCINTSGEIVVPCIYFFAPDFSEGLAVVKKDGKWSILEISEVSEVPEITETTETPATAVPSETAASPSDEKSPPTGDSYIGLLCFGISAVFALIFAKIPRLKKIR